MEEANIKDICPGPKDNWKITARVLRQWEGTDQSRKETQTYNIVLIGKDLSKIQATTWRKDLIERFRTYVKEGKSYVFQNFMVGDNAGKFKSTKHKYKLTLNYATTLTPCESSIPLHCFNFIKFDQINTLSNPEEYLIDVIGTVVEYGDLVEYTYNGTTDKMVVFKLLDDHETVMRCALFGTLAIEGHAFFTSGSDLNILALQFARIRFFGGQNTIASYWNATKLFTNPDIAEAAVFRQRSNPISLCSQMITQVSSSSRSTFKVEIHNETLRKTIAEVREAHEGGLACIVGTIHSLVSTENWYYYACIYCRGNTTEANQVYACQKCHKTTNKANLSYRMHICVIDPTGSAVLVLFDTFAQKLVNKTVVDLLDDMEKAGKTFGFPNELEVLVGKQFCFLIDIDPYWCITRKSNKYTVKEMSEDTNLIDKLLENPKFSQQADGPEVFAEPSQDQYSFVGDNEVESFETPTSSNKKKNEIGIGDSQLLGLSQLLSPQFSSSKPVARIKMEKDP